jgi:hypothetical protein
VALKPEVRSVLVLTCVLASASCAHGHLAPAANAQVVPETTSSAIASDAGVRVVASLDDWRGIARELPDGITAIKVRVVNRGARPVSILYERFALEGRRGHRYRVVPAVPLSHATLLAGMGPIQPIFAAANFEVAPRYHDIYPSLDPWPTALPRTGASEGAGGRWGELAPNRELCRMELPEGVLSPEGEITGYLYFEDPTGSEKALTLVANLASEKSGDTVASVKIPLQVE